MLHLASLVGLMLFYPLILVMPINDALAADDFTYLETIDDLSLQDWTIIDTRDAGACTSKTLAGARCLPVNDFMGPHDRMAGFADIAWLLGTAGIDGSEQVLIVGQQPSQRDFVAGVLHVMGQRQIAILRQPVAKLVSANLASVAGGILRSKTRLKVYMAPARSEHVIFARELDQRIVGAGGVKLLDGRSEAEYWGKKVRTTRGGHLPGADHLPAKTLRSSLARGEYPGPLPNQGQVVVYAHGPFEGYAYYTLVRAGLGLDATVFADGWAAWAASARHVDAATYPEQKLSLPAGAPSTIFDSMSFTLIAMFMGLLMLVMLGLGIVIGRRRTA